VRRGYLGIDIVDIDFKRFKGTSLMMLPVLKEATNQEDLLRRLGLADAAGALVTGVYAESPAEAAGLKQVDVITEFDGRPVRTIHELVLRVVELEPGRTVKLKYLRDRKAQEASVTLGERPRLASTRVPAPVKRPK
jgi:serine protease Do